MKKDESITIIAAIILIFTALVDWTIYSWLVLVGISIFVSVWYLRKTEDNAHEISI